MGGKFERLTLNLCRSNLPMVSRQILQKAARLNLPRVGSC